MGTRTEGIVFELGEGRAIECPKNVENVIVGGVVRNLKSMELRKCDRVVLRGCCHTLFVVSCPLDVASPEEAQVRTKP
jgi:hypothetical protein